MRIIYAAIGVLLTATAANSQQTQPADSKTVKTEYMFAVRPGRPPLAIRVEIGAGGKIGDALVFHGDATPVQRLASCQPELAMELSANDQDVLIEHADFNFDGYEDLKLLQFHHPHLGKSIFCVYLWDETATRFRYEPQIPMPDPIPHPETKTIMTHNEFMGGTHSDSVYGWISGKVTEIATWGLINEGATSRPGCPWFAYCDKRINGKMQKVTFKVTGCNGTAPEEVVCIPPPLRLF